MSGLPEFLENPAEAPDFQPFPKIPRLSKEAMIITEKIDGTNAQIWISPGGRIQAGSRNRWITPEQDNFGFARWVEENKQELLKLGHGRHFGEWFGQGIQRGYGLTEKRFLLFNTFRPAESLPPCVGQVPVLCRHRVDSQKIQETLELLRAQGSVAVPGFMKPEGIVVYYATTRTHFKVLLENDDRHKGELEASLASP